MPLAAGTRLGPYEIVSPLGVGGMGEVYRARDTRLDRDVAVKVLPAAFAADPDRLRRFEVEARAAGMLNHPNILTVYDLGVQDGAPYLVTELLEGETLRERLSPSALALRKALDYGRQIVAGLAAAHEKGITHRDLKPENLFVTTDGRVKILDFGLAKLTQVERGDVTETAHTQPGVVLGTTGYMSPEQVTGQPADHRSDIFSLGTVLYEMLSGRRAFRGETAPEAMTAILRHDPPALEGIPEGVWRVVSHCLEKTPLERFQSARDLGFALEALSGSGPAAAAAPVKRSRRALVILGAVGLVLAALAAGYLAGRRSGNSEPVYKRLTFRRGTIFSARFSPEGKSVVYSAAWDGRPPELFITRLDIPESRPLGIRSAEVLAISVSGEMALLRKQDFLQQWKERPGTLARVPLGGGTPRDVMEDVEDAIWSADGSALGVLRVTGTGRRIEFPIGKVLYETSAGMQRLRVSPRGDRLAFAEHPSGLGSNWSVVVLDRQGNRRSFPTPEGGDFVDLAWSPDGEEVWLDTRYGGSGKLLAVSLSGRIRELIRSPIQPQLLDVSPDGRALVGRSILRNQIFGVPPGETEEREISWLDISEVNDLSADGRTLLITDMGESSGANTWSVYLRATDGSTAVRIGEGQGLGLSPDGKWALTIHRAKPAQLVLLPTGAGSPVALPQGGIVDYWGGNWLPDGKRILFAGSEAGHGLRYWVQDLAGGSPRPITGEGVQLRVGQKAVSPDGRSAAVIEPDGRVSIYPLEGGQPRAIPNYQAWDRPIRWTDDGRALFALRRSDLTIFRIDVDSGRAQAWKRISPPDPAGVIYVWGVQIAADGKSYYYSCQRSLSDLYLVEGL